MLTIPMPTCQCIVLLCGIGIDCQPGRSAQCFLAGKVWRRTGATYPVVQAQLSGLKRAMSSPPLRSLYGTWLVYCVNASGITVWLRAAQLYRVRAQGAATAPLHSQGTSTVPHLVAGDVARVRVRHLCAHHGQHAHARHEGKLSYWPPPRFLCQLINSPTYRRLRNYCKKT